MEFDYNTSREILKIPEYGRNIHNMVKYVMTIENRDERNAAARSLIGIMGNMNPHLRDVADFKRKLWDHLAIMSDFQLDIDYPVEPIKPSALKEKPNKVEYINTDTKYKHYGRTIELFLKKAATLEKEDERMALVSLIANHMKKTYLSWNKEIVSDEIVLRDIADITNGIIQLKEGDIKIADPRESGRKRKNRPMNTKKKQQSQ